MRFPATALPAGLLLSVCLMPAVLSGRTLVPQQQSDQGSMLPHVPRSTVFRRVESRQTENGLVMRLVVEDGKFFYIKQFVVKDENITI